MLNLNILKFYLLVSILMWYIMVSKELERLIGLIQQVRGVVTEPNVEALRASFEQLASMTKIPKDAKCEPLNIEGVPSEWISVPESINDRVILYLHGGGYVLVPQVLLE